MKKIVRHIAQADGMESNCGSGAFRQGHHHRGSPYQHVGFCDFVALLYLCGRTSPRHDQKRDVFWPLGSLLKSLGAVPVDRSRGATLLRQTVEAFAVHEKFHLAIAPEGTRQRTKNWKAGFHTIARMTGADVYLGYFDWGRKEVGWFEIFPLTGDAQADVSRMKGFYRSKGLTGKHPELYTAEE